MKLATLLGFRVTSYALTVLNAATSCSLVAMARLLVVVASLCLHRQESVRHVGNTWCGLDEGGGASVMRPISVDIIATCVWTYEQH